MEFCQSENEGTLVDYFLWSKFMTSRVYVRIIFSRSVSRKRSNLSSHYGVCMYVCLFVCLSAWM